VSRVETEDRRSGYGEVLFTQVGIVISSWWVEQKDDKGADTEKGIGSFPCSC
jgi:hypothetical protein